jgi:hypothetical protein
MMYSGKLHHRDRWRITRATHSTEGKEKKKRDGRTSCVSPNITHTKMDEFLLLCGCCCLSIRTSYCHRHQVLITLSYSSAKEIYKKM